MSEDKVVEFRLLDHNSEASFILNCRFPNKRHRSIQKVMLEDWKISFNHVKKYLHWYTGKLETIWLVKQPAYGNSYCFSWYFSFLCSIRSFLEMLRCDFLDISLYIITCLISLHITWKWKCCRYENVTLYVFVGTFLLDLFLSREESSNLDWQS